MSAWPLAPEALPVDLLMLAGDVANSWARDAEASAFDENSSVFNLDNPR